MWQGTALPRPQHSGGRGRSNSLGSRPAWAIIVHLRTVRASRETLSENPNQAQTGPLGSFLGSSSLNTQPHCPESLCEAAVAQQGLVHHNVLKSMLSQGRPADDGLQAHRGPSEPKLRAGMPQTYTGTSMVLQLMLHWGPSAAAPSFSSDPRKEPQKGTPCPLYLSPLCQAHSTPTALGSSAAHHLPRKPTREQPDSSYRGREIHEETMTQGRLKGTRAPQSTMWETVSQPRWHKLRM